MVIEKEKLKKQWKKRSESVTPTLSFIFFFWLFPTFNNFMSFSVMGSITPIFTSLFSCVYRSFYIYVINFSEVYIYILVTNRWKSKTRVVAKKLKRWKINLMEKTGGGIPWECLSFIKCNLQMRKWLRLRKTLASCSLFSLLLPFDP